MAIVSVGELFDRASRFEKKLAEYYASLRDKTENNGVRLLTYYLSRHRRHLEEVKNSLDIENITHIFSVKLKYDVNFDPDDDTYLLKISNKNISGQKLLEEACGFDERLIALYKDVLNQPLNNEVLLFIQSLLRLEEKDIVMLKKMIAMNYF